MLGACLSHFPSQGAPRRRATAAAPAETVASSTRTAHLSAPCPLPEAGLGRPYLGVGQVSEGLAGLQRLQELHNGCDATLWQEHAAQAAEAAEGLLQLSCQGARREVLHQDHGLASFGSSLQGGDKTAQVGRWKGVTGPPLAASDRWINPHQAPM